MSLLCFALVLIIIFSNSHLVFFIESFLSLLKLFLLSPLLSPIFSTPTHISLLLFPPMRMGFYVKKKKKNRKSTLLHLATISSVLVIHLLFFSLFPHCVNVVGPLPKQIVYLIPFVNHRLRQQRNINRYIKYS